MQLADCTDIDMTRLSLGLKQVVTGSLLHGGVLVYGGDRESSRGGTRVIGLRGLSRTLDELDGA
jgi:hypothetical protein